MKLGKCDKCGEEIALNALDSRILFTTIDRTNYPVCYECWREWYDGGYYEIWCALSYDLADKFTLDFLDKLG